MKRFVWFIKHIEEILAGSALVLMLLITIYNVVMRYCFGNPRGWAAEMAVFCLIWATFLGASACYKRNMHYGMDYLVDHLPDRAKLITRRCITFLCMLLFAFLTWISFDFVKTVTKTTSFFHLSYKYLDAAVVLGFLSMTVYAAVYLVQSFVSPEKFSARYALAYEEDNNETPANVDVPPESERRYPS